MGERADIGSSVHKLYAKRDFKDLLKVKILFCLSVWQC